MIRTPAGPRRGAYEASPCPGFSISASTTAETDRHGSPRSCGNSRPRQADAPAVGAPATHRSAARAGPAPASLVDGRRKDSTLRLRSRGPVDPSACGPGREQCRPTEPSRRRRLPATHVNPRTRRSHSACAPRPQKGSSCSARGGACATTWRAPGLAVYAPWPFRWFVMDDILPERGRSDQCRPERQREACHHAGAERRVAFGAGDALREAVDLDVSVSRTSRWERPQLSPAG